VIIFSQRSSFFCKTALFILVSFKMNARKKFVAFLSTWFVILGTLGVASASEPRLNEPIRPLPRTVDLDPAKVSLGKLLFNDPRLSGDNTVSCETCHQMNLGGADGLEKSIGTGGRKVAMNAPTVFNSGYNVVQNWDGRKLSLEDQIDGPIHSKNGMSSTWPKIIVKLQQDKNYKAAFKQIYGGVISEQTIKNAIVTFERSLITPDAPFDKYLRGDDTAISETARAGYGLFTSLGCVACHQGINVGGNMYQRFGVMERNFLQEDSTYSKGEHLGRFNITGRTRDRNVFKVPSLRNIAETAPYFHDGSAANLETAVLTMARVQLGVILSEDDLTKIIAFLKSLSGHLIGEPVSP
jgi:cytochrome c peroxidase